MTCNSVIGMQHQFIRNKREKSRKKRQIYAGLISTDSTENNPHAYQIRSTHLFHGLGNILGI
jgi:hypothetical protein